MKKIAFTFCLLMMAQGAFAYIMEGTSTDIGAMQNRGYSQATLKIIDQQKAHKATPGVEYVKYYENPYYKKPDTFTKKIGYWYDRIKVWVDPVQDDKIFGEREINFDNKFFYDQPATTKIEDL